MRAMIAQAKGTMQYTSWEEKTYSRVDGGPKLTNSAIVRKVGGDIEGVGTLDYVMIYLDDQNTRFLGYEQIVGTLGERTGSFVLQHDGVLENGVAKVALSVVPGSGTGGFRGMRGSGTFVAPDANTSSFTLDYSFD